MSDYELINLTLDQIRRIAGIIEQVRVEQWHLLKANGEGSISGKIMKDCYDKNEAALRQCRFALRDILDDIAEHQNANDMTTQTDVELSAVPFRLIYDNNMKIIHFNDTGNERDTEEKD